MSDSIKNDLALASSCVQHAFPAHAVTANEPLPDVTKVVGGHILISSAQFRNSPIRPINMDPFLGAGLRCLSHDSNTDFLIETVAVLSLTLDVHSIKSRHDGARKETGSPNSYSDTRYFGHSRSPP